MWYVSFQAKTMPSSSPSVPELTFFVVFFGSFLFSPPPCFQLRSNQLPDRRRRASQLLQHHGRRLLLRKPVCSISISSHFSRASSHRIPTLSPSPPKQDIPSRTLRVRRIQLQRERALGGKPCSAILRDRQRHTLLRIYRRSDLIITFLIVSILL